MKRYLPFIIIAAVLLLAVGGGIWLISSNSAREHGGAQPVPGFGNSSSTAAESTSAGSPVAARPPAPGADPPNAKGDPNASVTLEEFGDFQCPPCGMLDPEMRKLETEFGPRLRVIFRNYPLTKMHKNALDAARAAEAAGQQGKYWEMHNRLYDKQGEWGVMPDPRPIFQDYARSLGLDVEKFKADMDSRRVEARIINDVTRGDSLGVKGTPTLFINGREVPAASMTLNGLRSAVNEALSGKS